MILDWLDRILARLLPVRTRNGGLHAREPGDVFDHSRAEVVTLPCHQPDPRWQLHTPAAVPLEFLEIHHPGNVPAAAHPAPAEAATPARLRPQAPSLPFTGERVPAAPVTPASARPETPNLDQGLWHLRPQQWQDDTGSFKAICEVAA